MTAVDPREVEGRKRPHWLYRLFDADGNLLYVGQTRNPAARFRIWFSRVKTEERFAWILTATRCDWQLFPDWESVVAAEKLAIEAETPLHNIQHRPLRVVA